MDDFDDIAKSLDKYNHAGGIAFFEDLLGVQEISPPANASDRDLDILADSVNTERLGNNPVILDKDTIKVLYKDILNISA